MAPKPGSRVRVSPDLENVFNSSVLGTADRAYAAEAARNAARTPVYEPEPQVDPDFNAKPDRIDRDEFSDAVRMASYQPGSMADRIARDMPDVELALQREGEYDPNLIRSDVTDPFSAEGVAARNAQEDMTLEEAKAAAVAGVEAGDPFDFTVEDAATAVMQAETEWLEAEDDERQIIENPPIVSLRGQTDRRDFMVSKYPTLALGLAQGKFTDREMRDTINFTVAFDAAMTLAQMPTVDMAQAFMGKMSIAQQLLVLDISNAMRQQQMEQMASGDIPKTSADYKRQIDEAASNAYQTFSGENLGLPVEAAPVGYVAEKIADRVARVGVINEEHTGNAFSTGVKQLWNWTGGLAFEVLFNDTNEALQKGWRFASLAADKLGGDQGNAAFGSNLGYANYETSWADVWAMSETNAVDQQMVAQIAEQYGPEKTNIALRLMEAQQSQDMEVLPQIILELSQRELAGDESAGELLTWLGDTQYAGGERYTEAMQVFDELQLARTGYTGNLFTVGIIGQPSEEDRLKVGQSTTYNVLSTSGQVFGYMLDPFWFAAPARAGAMASRYGMWRLLTAESRGLNRTDEFTSIFSQRTVQRALTSLGEDLRAIDEAGDLGVAGQTRKSVEARWKRYLNPAALDDIRGYMRTLPEDEAYKPQAFQDFFENNENLVYLVQGEHALRGKQLVVPHMTVATAQIKKATMALRGLTYERGRGAEYVNELLGAGFTTRMPEEAAEALGRALQKAETEDEIARVLGDFVWREDGTGMVRSFTGNAAGLTGMGTGKYGWRTKGTTLVSRRWWQRKRRIGQRMPMDGGPIVTVDGSEASRVGDLLEWSGMPRYFSRAVEEIWANPATTNAQRTAMLPGLVRAAVKAKGIDQVDETGEIMDRIAGYTRGDIYSPEVPNMTEIAPAIREQVRAENFRVLEAERIERFNTLGRDLNSYRPDDEVFFWDGKKWIEAQVANITRSGGVRIKGQGNKTINKDLLVPKAGRPDPVELPTRLDAEELGRILDEAIPQTQKGARDAKRAAARNTSERGVREATGRLAAFRSRSGTIRLRREFREDYGAAYTRFGGGSTLLEGDLNIVSVATWQPEPGAAAIMDEVGFGLTTLHEIDDAAGFLNLITRAKQSNTYGAAVFVYDVDDYAQMRLFITEDGTAGFALKGDDIVSVFKAEGSPQRGFATSSVILAIGQGGRRADAFDTELPHLYTRMGMRPVARQTFDDEFAPEGWDFDTFRRYNQGRPDVLYFAYDPAYVQRYVGNEGVLVSTYDDAVAVQAAAVRSLAVPGRQTSGQALREFTKAEAIAAGKQLRQLDSEQWTRFSRDEGTRSNEKIGRLALASDDEAWFRLFDEPDPRLLDEDAVVTPVPGPSTYNFEPRLFSRPEVDLDTNRASRRIIKKARQNEPRRSASEVAPGQNAAVVLSDATERMAFPNITALDAYSRRASVLTALLGNNKWMQGVTDIWTLGTLAGPRFQVRSGIEDIGLYLLTGGELGSITTGRAMAQAIRKSTMRTKNTGMINSKRAKRVGTDDQGRPIYESVEPDRPQKLGIVATGWRNAVNGLTDGVLKSMSRALFNRDYSPALDTLNHVLVAQATKTELRLAAEAAAEGNRTALATLVGKVYLRQRFAGHPVFGWIAKVGGKDIDDLSDAQRADLAYLDDAVEFEDPLRSMEDVSELSSHLFDGAPIYQGGAVPVGQVFWDTSSKRWMRRVFKDDNWQTVPMNSSDMRTIDWFNSLAKAMPIADGPKAYAGLSRLVRWVQATQKRDAVAKNEIIDEVAEVIERYFDDDVWGYGRRMVIADQKGARGLAEATLENLRVLFTGRNGDMNWELYNKVRVQGDEFAEFSIRRVADDGTVEYNVSVDDLRNMSDFQKPLGVISNLGETMDVPARQTWTQFGWGGMGRSLARMTREPIFMGQYLESRRILQPLQDARKQRLLDEGFEEPLADMKAREWATKAAAERAYNTTMDYVDNPAIRSQLAWEVRNVARFYRALEDFGRRMMRTARNQPSAFLKLGAAWRVIDSSGFFWEDEYGEQYFIWPGTPQMFSGVNWFLNNVVDRGGMYTPDLPLAFSSNVTMLTPSADPNAIFPTFSGFYSAATLLPVVDAFKSLFGADVEQELFGEYSKNTQWPLGALPPHLVRVLQGANAMSGSTDETSVRNRLSQNRSATGLNSLYVSSAFSAIQAAGAAGWWDESEYMDDSAKADLLRRVDRSAVWIAGLKIALSPIFPAALQVQDLSASDFARSLGYNDLRSEFIQLLKVAETPDEAVVAWMQMYPDGRSPFIAVEGRGGAELTSGYWTPFKETADFVENHKDLVDSNPLGLSFFQPSKGETTLRAFDVLKVNKLTPEGTPVRYLEKVLTAHADAVMEQEKRLYLQDRLAGNVPQKVWSQTRIELQDRFPNMGGGTVTIPADTNFEFGSQEYESTAVARMRQAGRELQERGALDQRGEYLMELIAVAEDMYRNLYPRDYLDPQGEKYRTEQGDYWDAVLEKAVRDNPNDSIMVSALRELTLHLDFAWPTEVEVASG